MKKNFNDPRGGMIIFLGVLLAALWLAIAYSAYEESKRVKYDVCIKPGAVTYGTRSTAVMPTVSVQTHRTHAPMVSGGTIRSYAYSGHASMSRTSSGAGYRLHTTSSATVHTISSGGGGGGGSVGTSSGGSSSRSISYSTGSVSMPTLAMATPSRSSYSVSSLRSSIADAASSMIPSTATVDMSGNSSVSLPGRSIRRAKPTWDGDNDGDEYTDPDDGTIWTWSEEAEGWVNTTPIGTKRYDSERGCMVEWNGTEWIPVSNQGDPGVPVGDASWHWMLLLIAGYAIVKRYVKKQNAI